MGVAAHQHLTSGVEPGVHDLRLVACRHEFFRREIAVGDHGDDLATEAPLVELERGLAPAIEHQVGVPLHRHAPLVFPAWLGAPEEGGEFTPPAEPAPTSAGAGRPAWHRI